MSIINSRQSVLGNHQPQHHHHQEEEQSLAQPAAFQQIVARRPLLHQYIIFDFSFLYFSFEAGNSRMVRLLQEHQQGITNYIIGRNLPTVGGSQQSHTTFNSNSSNRTTPPPPPPPPPHHHHHHHHHQYYQMSIQQQQPPSPLPR